jgi:hypothetical protein
MADQSEVSSKTFHLTQHQREKIILIRQHLDALLSIEISALAADQFAYRVTDRTTFEIAEDYTSIRIFEKPSAINQTAPNSPVKAA